VSLQSLEFGRLLKEVSDVPPCVEEWNNILDNGCIVGKIHLVDKLDPGWAQMILTLTLTTDYLQQ
jgi:hypothetical protein